MAAQPEIRYHTFMDYDADLILLCHKPHADTMSRRLSVQQALDAAIKKHTSGRFSVADRSVYTYAMDAEELEMELVPLDSFTFKPSDAKKVPEYSQTPTSLYQALEDASCNITPLTPYPSSLNDSLVPSINASSRGVQFILHPPSLFHYPFQHLLEEYVFLYPALRHVLPLLHLWRRAHNIPSSELSTSCLTLMVIVSLLVKQDAITLDLLSQDQDLQWLDWQDVSSVGTPPKGQMDWTVWRELHIAKRIAENQPQFALTAESILVAFFQLWLGDRFARTKSAISVRGGGFIPRVAPKPQAGPDGELVPKNFRPKSWNKAVLVIQDPFLVTHNHAHRVSNETWGLFISSCKKSLDILKTRAPLHVILGNLGLPPRSPNDPPVFNPALAQSMRSIYEANMPSIKIKLARERTIKKVKGVIQNKYGSQYRIECFGSTRYGVDSDSSDLDMLILDTNRTNGFHPSLDLNSLPAPYNMRQVGRALQRAGFTQVIAITSASVPIVKFQDPATGLHVDLNCNEQLGLINTILLNNYCLAWPHLRRMLFFIKKWAKSVGLNDPSGVSGPSSFSSYCLALMTVAYLQAKGVLPHLQKCADEEEVDRESSGFWMRSRPNRIDDRVWCDTRFKEPEVGWTGSPMSLDEVVCGWFRYFAYEHRYEKDILSIRYGGLVPRQHPFQAADSHPQERDKGRQKKKAAKSFSAIKDGVEGGATIQPSTARSASSDLETAAAHVTPIGDAANDEEVAAAEAQAETALEVDQETAEALQEEQEENERDSLEPAESDTWDQPRTWASSSLVVVDPFITVKNCTSACKVAVIERFQHECERAISMLELGRPIEALFGDGSPLFSGKDGNPRRTQRPMKMERPPKPVRQVQPASASNSAQRSSQDTASAASRSQTSRQVQRPGPTQAPNNQPARNQAQSDLTPQPQQPSLPLQQQQMQQMHLAVQREQQQRQEYLLQQQYQLQQRMANSYLPYQEFLQLQQQQHLLAQQMQTVAAMQAPTTPNILVPYSPPSDRRNPTSNQFHQAVLQAARGQQRSNR
ncbi:hypothetical protein FRB93_011307 [Tulasnella sp. JGI-2019a]|nr:hypothetical protein FRB93_011307 [Tulasnella sp. JGI-2019a]